MPVREFVKDPETGKPATVVTNFEVVEITDLEGVVANETATREQEAAEVENIRTQLEAAQAKLDATDVRLGDAKSELGNAQAVVGEPATGVDEGADGTSVPVTVVETPPADPLF